MYSAPVTRYEICSVRHDLAIMIKSMGPVLKELKVHRVSKAKLRAKKTR
jgi:hypothetical protein